MQPGAGGADQENDGEGREQRSEVLTQLLSRQTSSRAHEVPLAAYNYAVSDGQRHG